MKFTEAIRSLVFLRRIARALEEANELTREEMRLTFPEYERKLRSRGKKQRKVEITHGTVEEWNKNWRENQQL